MPTACRSTFDSSSDAAQLGGVEPAEIVLAVGEEHEQRAAGPRGEERPRVERVAERRRAAGEDAAQAALEPRDDRRVGLHPAPRSRGRRSRGPPRRGAAGRAAGARPAAWSSASFSPSTLPLVSRTRNVAERQRFDRHQLDVAPPAAVPQLEVRLREPCHGPPRGGHEHVHEHRLRPRCRSRGLRRLAAHGARAASSARPAGHDEASRRRASSRSSTPTADPHGYSQKGSRCCPSPAGWSAASTSRRAPGASPRRHSRWLSASRADWQRGWSARAAL